MKKISFSFLILAFIIMIAGCSSSYITSKSFSRQEEGVVFFQLRYKKNFNQNKGLEVFLNFAYYGDVETSGICRVYATTNLDSKSSEELTCVYAIPEGFEEDESYMAKGVKSEQFGSLVIYECSFNKKTEARVMLDPSLFIDGKTTLRLIFDLGMDANENPNLEIDYKTNDKGIVDIL